MKKLMGVGNIYVSKENFAGIGINGVWYYQDYYTSIEALDTNSYQIYDSEIKEWVTQNDYYRLSNGNIIGIIIMNLKTIIGLL